MIGAMSKLASLGIMPMFSAPRPSCYRIFSMLRNGWRPARRQVIVGQYKDMPIPSFLAKTLPRLNPKPGVGDNLGERIRRLAKIERTGYISDKDQEVLTELRELMKIRKAG